MKEQDIVNYNRIAEAIRYIQQNFRRQPDLDEVAAQVHLSPFHFQRLFTEWAGISPKKFLQFTSVQYAKSLLRARQSTLFDAALDTGLSSSSRLHDLFVKIEGMTPAEYKQGGKDLQINYSYETCLFGRLLIASTPKGVCYMAFYDDENQALANLRTSFPNARVQQARDQLQNRALSIFQQDWSSLPEIKLHLKGTDFQLRVWENLLKIPMGRLVTYGKVAQDIAMPGAARAVGAAIGSNPVAFLIPCHRVIKSSGLFGGYMWNPVRKTAIIGWEGAITHPELPEHPASPL